MQSGRPTSQNISGVPICGAGDRIIGVVFASCNHDFSFGDLGPTIGRYLLPAASVITLFAALVGVGFGFLTARRLGNRLDLIAGAADAWSRGDFGASAPGDERDELGELARRLNQMAVELQSLLALRQEVAILQERNRLARDLHDTVKQQVFATSMQVGAARSLLDRDPEAARQRLADAEKLAGQVQRELNCILQELRPAPGEGQGLAALLRSYTGDWARQAGIPISLKIEDDLPLQIRTSQELFRVAQEALANVARHSRASGVKIQCLVDGDHVFLSVADNGCGFEVNSVLKGMGIQNMRERSESLPGGQFFVRSQPGHGAMIEARCLANRPKD